FREQVVAGNVESVFAQGDSLQGRFREPVTWPPEDRPELAADAGSPRAIETFETTLPVFIDPGFEELLLERGVIIRPEPIETGNTWTTLLFGFGPALLLILFYVWFMRRITAGGGVGGAALGLGRSRARRYDRETGQRVTFEDVAGIDEAEGEL